MIPDPAANIKGKVIKEVMISSVVGITMTFTAIAVPFIANPAGIVIIMFSPLSCYLSTMVNYKLSPLGSMCLYVFVNLDDSFQLNSKLTKLYKQLTI